MNREAATENLLEAKSILDTLGVQFWLTCGTLLGYYREGTFIEHDNDIDLGAFIAQDRPEIIPSFKMAGWTHYHTFGTPKSGLEYAFVKNGIKVDLFFHYRDRENYWMGVWKRGKLRKYVFPIFELREVEWLDTRFLVPTNTEAFLERHYGKDWRTPKKKWDYFTSPRSIQGG